METLLTVLITLMVVALIGAGIILFRLDKKVQEVEVLRRDIERINQEVGKLDSIINPNKDILKG